MLSLRGFHVALFLVPLGFVACGGGDGNGSTGSSSGGGSATATSSSTGTTTSTSTSTSTGGMVEDCFDGVDNDNNGKTDCDDPACKNKGYIEVPNTFAYGTLDAANCASGKVTSGQECSACSGCAVQIGTCAPSVEIYKDAGCQFGPNAGNYMNGGCYKSGIFGNNGKDLSYIATAVDDVAATCTNGSATSTPHSFCQVDLPYYQNAVQLEVACVKPTGCVLVSGALCPPGFQAKPVPLSKACGCDCTATQTCSTNGMTTRIYDSSVCDPALPYFDLTMDGNCHDSGKFVIDSVGFSASLPAVNASCAEVPKFNADDTLCCAN
jgi:hypothetical protein